MMIAHASAPALASRLAQAHRSIVCRLTRAARSKVPLTFVMTDGSTIPRKHVIAIGITSVVVRDLGDETNLIIGYDAIALLSRADGRPWRPRLKVNELAHGDEP